jgi:hypothetical protein
MTSGVSSHAQTSTGTVALGGSVSIAVTVSIPAAGTLAGISVLAAGSPNLDFTAQTGGSCGVGAAYGAGATCTVEVQFAPLATGLRTGAVVLASATGVLGTTYLIGTGKGTAAALNYPGVTEVIGTGFGSPGCVAVDGAGDVFVADAGGKSIAGGLYKETFSLATGSYTQTAIGSGFTGPLCVAIDGAGNLFVTDSPGVLYKETPANGTYTQSVLRSRYKDPVGVAVDTAGDVFVADSTLQSITVVQPNGEFGELGSGWVAPSSIARVGRSEFAVVDNKAAAGPSVILLTLSSGVWSTADTTLGTTPTGFGGIAADGAGNLYTTPDVPESTPGPVDQFVLAKATGGYLETAVGGGFTNPAGLAVDGAGNVYVADAAAGTVSGVFVNLAPSTITVTSSAATQNSGSSVTFTAQVSPLSTVQPGTITFSIDGSVVATVAGTASGSATYSTSTLTTGTHTVLASFAGNTTLAPSTSAPFTETISAIVTGIVLATNDFTPTYVSTVTFITLVYADSGTSSPSGNVTFSVDGVAAGTVALNSNGIAIFSTTAITAGTHLVQAVFGAQAQFNGSNSNTITEAVTLAPTVTTLASSLNPQIPIGTTTFTATVTLSPAGTAPTGNVAFTIDGAAVGAVALSGGTAAYTATNLPAGIHSVVAAYAGSASMLASTSAALSQVVAEAATTTSLISSLNPATPGTAVTFTASVAGAYSSTTPTGSITFTIDGLAAATASLTAGSAAYTTSTLPPGGHSVVATYSGDTNFLTGTSIALSEAVTLATTNTTLVTSSSDAIPGQLVTFTATVGGIPSWVTSSGSVVFTIDGSAAATVALTGSTATYSTSALAVGGHTVVAAYEGDAQLTGSASTALTETVSANVARYDVFGDSISAGCCTLNNDESFVDLLAADWGVTLNVNLFNHAVSSTTVADAASFVYAVTRTAGIDQVSTFQFGINDIGWTNAGLNNSAFGPTEQSAIMAQVLWLATPLAQPNSAEWMQPANTVCTGQAGWAASTLQDPFIPDRDFNNGFAETFQMAGSTAGNGCWATVEGAAISIGYTATAATSGTAQVTVDGQPAAILTSQPYYTPLAPGGTISGCETLNSIETCTFNAATGAPFSGSTYQIVIQGASDPGTNGAFWPCTGIDTPATGCTVGPAGTTVQFYNSLAAADSAGGQIGNNLAAFSDTLFGRTFIPQVLQITEIGGTPLASGTHTVGVVPVNGGAGNNIYLDYFTGNGGMNPYIGPKVALLGVERILNRSNPDWMTAIWDQFDRNVATILDGEGYPVSYADIRDAQGAYPGGPIERYMWPENQITCTASMGSLTLTNCSIVEATSTDPNVGSLATSAYVDDLGATLPPGSTIQALTNNSITISPYVSSVTFTPGSGQNTAGCTSQGVCTVESTGGGCILAALADFQITGGAIQSATVEPGSQGGFCTGAPSFTVSHGGVSGTITAVMSTGAIASGPTTVQVYFPGAHPCQGQSYCLGGHAEFENAVLNALTASGLQVGKFSTTASYHGDSNSYLATSIPFSLTVKSAAPPETGQSSANSSGPGSPLPLHHR